MDFVFILPAHNSATTFSGRKRISVDLLNSASSIPSWTSWHWHPHQYTCCVSKLVVLQSCQQVSKISDFLGLGPLGNISVGGPELWDHAIEQGIIKPLLHLIKLILHGNFFFYFFISYFLPSLCFNFIFYRHKVTDWQLLLICINFQWNVKCVISFVGSEFPSDGPFPFGITTRGAGGR